MSVSLVKGQKIDLTKNNAALNNIIVGLGWDPAAGGSSIDCDASAILLDSNGKMTDKKDVVYYRNKVHSSKCVRSTGDNLTGHGDGDDEQLIIEFDKVPERIGKIVFVVNIYNCKSRRQDFGMIRNAYIRVVDSRSNQELLRYSLSDDYAGKTALIVGEVYRHNGEWKFAAIGEGTGSESISDLADLYK